LLRFISLPRFASQRAIRIVFI